MNERWHGAGTVLVKDTYARHTEFRSDLFGGTNVNGTLYVFAFDFGSGSDSYGTPGRHRQ